MLICSSKIPTNKGLIMNTHGMEARTPQSIAEENVRFMTGVYKWMTIGLLLTGCIAYYFGTNEEYAMQIASNRILFYGMVIAQFGLVIYLSARINKMSAKTATVIYLLYAALTGVTFSTIFLIYTQDSIYSTFLLTAFSFAGLSAFGFITKRDLGPIGTFCHMGLWGLVGFSILSIFFPSMLGGQMGTVFSLVGVVVFAGLTAYDTQKIKNSNIIGNEGTEEDHKETISGALTLYLDFINLFLMLLRLVGGRRD
jgi:FtsH-binding integral membrane protein